MVTMVKSKRNAESLPQAKDDFENYLKQQRVKTTFNGTEIAEFSWYKKILGLRS